MRVLVIGANRGIGFNLAKTFVDRGWDVLGSYRPQSKADPSVGELRALGIRLLEMDVLDETSVASAAEGVKDTSLDVLVNCAGIGPLPVKWQEHTPSILMEMLQTNTVGPFVTAKAFFPLLCKSSAGKIVNITSNMASMEDNGHGTNLGYRISKTAVNQMTVTIARELKAIGSPVTVNAIHPGWVPTRMSRWTGPDDMETVVSSLATTIEHLDSASNGRYMDRDGKDMAF